MKPFIVDTKKGKVGISIPDEGNPKIVGIKDSSDKSTKALLSSIHRECAGFQKKFFSEESAKKSIEDALKAWGEDRFLSLDLGDGFDKFLHQPREQDIATKKKNDEIEKALSYLDLRG